jgi:hypothetical protein
LNTLRDAFRALHEHPFPLAIYILGMAALDYFLRGVALLAGYPVGSDALDVELSPKLDALSYGLDIFLAGAASVLMCVAFSRLGRELDKPLWKVRGDWEAIRRFFALWFLLNLATLTLYRIAGSRVAASSDSVVAELLFLAFLVVQAMVVPVGACIMFGGGLRWKDLAEHLHPLVRNLPQVLPVLGVSLLSLLVVISVIPFLVNLIWLVPLVNIISSYVDCLVFVAMWLICMMHRDTFEDIDLDF